VGEFRGSQLTNLRLSEKNQEWVKPSPNGHCSHQKNMKALAAVDARGKLRTVQLENNLSRSINTKSKRRNTNRTHEMQNPIFPLKPTRLH
jgi:hypothetical protein